MLIAYNRNNRLGGGCQDQDLGLTEYGRQIIDEMERVGIIAEALIKRGYGDTQIQGILGHNNLRIATRVWK